MKGEQKQKNENQIKKGEGEIKKPEPKVFLVSFKQSFSLLKEKYFSTTKNAALSRPSPRVLLGVSLAMLTLLAGVFYFREQAVVSSGEYTQTYSLVNEKVSKNAPIAIHLPEGITKEEAKGAVTFEPKIKGEWMPTDVSSELSYKPQSPLEAGKYYSVNIETPNMRLRGDFLADEDPKIEAVFPSDGSETNENSSVTIIFNRPMVPLTTLAELEKMNEVLPVKIFPKTEGRFKWISTRNLQFIPKDRLFRSTRYKLVVGEGLVSMDGLPIQGATHEFTTRPLRYGVTNGGQTLYNQPISLFFNQPVDLERTAKEILVRNGVTGEVLNFTAEYGVTRNYNKKTKRYEEFVDRSVLRVYQKKDKHGREGLWDFNTGYRLEIAKAYPLEGDIVLNEARSVSIQVPEIIESLSAESKRSQYVRPNLFDPEGELIVSFYEEVNKERSVVRAKGLLDTRYGEICKKDDDGNAIFLGSGECEKEENKKVLILRFDPSVFGRAESVPVSFEKIYNTAGMKINTETIVKTAVTYPKLRIIKTVPSKSSAGASLTELVVCSNTPIQPKSKEEYRQSLITSGYLVFGGWQNPVYVENASSYYKCAAGEFENRIRYGLLPETDYSLTLKLEDDFGGKIEQLLSFKTAKAPEEYTRFYNLQKAYNVTSPGKTKFTYAVENLEYVNMHICKLSAENLLEKTSNQPKPTEPPSSSSCESVKTDIIPLPKRYWVNNYFQINLAKYFPDTLGHYIISFGNPRYIESYGSRRPIYDRTYVSVTRLAVAEKRAQWNADYYAARYQKENSGRDIPEALMGAGKNLYWVSRFNTLESVMGATVSVYAREEGTAERGENAKVPIHFVSSFVTNAEGVVAPEAVQNIAGAVVRYGNDSAILSPWADTLLYAQGARNAEKTYLYTDRPIYRPGQEVFFRGLDRVGYDGSYEVFRGKNAKVKIFDSRGTVIYEQSLPIGEYGTFAASVLLKNDAPLGTYRMEAFGNSAWFDVEEYVPSAFKVDVTSQKEEYISGEPMKIDVDAQYYFGVPVSGGTIEYSVTSQDYHFDRYTDEYFNFGKGWYSCYSCGYGDSFLFRGKAETDENGKAHIEKEIDFSKFFKDFEDEGSKIFVLDITVKDANGRSVSSQKSFIVHRGEFYLGVKTDRYSALKNTEFTVRAKSVDTLGKPESVSNITLEIHKVTWETFKRREVDGGYYYRTEKRLKLVKKETFQTDRKGDWSGVFALPEEGEYEIRTYAKDSLKNTVSGTVNMYVYGEGQADIRPTNNYTLEIETETLNVNAGDAPKIIVKSPYKHAKALITVERGKIFDYHIVDVDRNLFDYAIPMKDEYAPNVYVSVLLLSDAPEIKFGQVMFTIGRKQYELKVDVRPNKTHYLPGEKVVLNVKTSDRFGAPVPAEVSLSVADLSVLALKGNPKKDPLVFFYDGFPLTITTASNIKNILYELDIPAGTKGGGGSDPDDLAQRKRGIFKDTAFWQSNVTTGADGTAIVSFTLPDNLTTWQVESLGITKNTLVGIDYDEIIARKDLMVVPLKPRFVISGDEFSLGAKVFNQTGASARFDVTLKSDTLALLDDGKKTVTVGKDKTETVYFKVKAPEDRQEGSHSFTLSAKRGEYVDTVESVMPITRNDTYETVATANFTKSDHASEYVYIPDNVILDKGGVTINANATMAVFLSGALQYLVSYPYGCSEQLASKLSSIGTVKRGLNLKNVGDKFTLNDISFEGKTYTVDEAVKLGLGRIYESQSGSGGFSYYSGMPENFYLTLHIVQALENLRKAGFDVNTETLNRASGYLYRTITTDARLYDNKDLVILTAFTLDNVEGFSAGNKDALKSRVKSIARDKAFLNEGISSVSLAHLAILTANKEYSKSLSNTVFQTLENRIDTDGRGAYLKENPQNMVYQFYETRAGDTALLLKAIVARKTEHPLSDKIMRWLLRSRSKDGAWGSTNTTLAVIDAMTDYLNWQKETESDFLLSGTLDGKKTFTFDFNKDTILQTFSHFIPINAFPLNKTSAIGFIRENRNTLKNNFYYDMSLKYYLPVDKIPPRDEGITITRTLAALTDEKSETPLSSAKVGDVLRGKLTIIVPKTYNLVSVEDFIPAGFELVNFSLSTEDKTLLKNKEDGQDYDYNDGMGAVALPLVAQQNTAPEARPGFFKRTWLNVKEFFGGETDPEQTTANTNTTYRDEQEKPTLSFAPDISETRDDRLFLFKEHLNPGVYEYEYYVRALVPGTFHHLPAKAEEMYFPEVFGRTAGEYFTVVE